LARRTDAQKPAESRAFAAHLSFTHSGGDVGEMWPAPLLFKGVLQNYFLAEMLGLGGMNRTTAAEARAK